MVPTSDDDRIDADTDTDTDDSQLSVSSGAASSSTTSSGDFDQDGDTVIVPAAAAAHQSPSFVESFHDTTVEEQRRAILTVHNHHFSPRPTTVTESTHEPATPATVPTSLDQERQILLLMLLAQVCALHDVTPKTFTVHVLELYERGILDPSSIHFLYDLGLVTQHPMMGANHVLPVPLASKCEPTPVAATTTTTTTTVTGTTTNQAQQQEQPLLLVSTKSAEDRKEQGILIPAVAAIPPPHHHHDKAHPPLQQPHSGDHLHHRSMEASAIRLSLRYHDQQLQQQQQQQQQRHARDRSESKTLHHSVSSWSVDEHPLSLSRYQREFKEIGRLASGSFGDVYRAINYMDGSEYAVKRVSFNAVGYSNATVQQVIREVHCLAVCDHPNIVRYYTSWLEPSWMTGNSTTPHRQLPNGTTNGSDDTDEYLQLITDLQSAISSGNSIGNLTENLQTYFNDASLRHCRRRSSIGGSIFDDDDNLLDDIDDHEDNANTDQIHLTLKDTRDDISIDGYCPRRHRRQQSEFAHTAGNPYESSIPQNSHYSSPLYQYQISLYIQMQLCNPTTLADWIRARNEKHQEMHCGLDDRIGDVVAIFEQLVIGLQHVHERNIIHRDLKPGNVFADDTGGATLHFKIGDFGLSKLVPTPNLDPLNNNSPTQFRRGRLQRQRQLLLLDANLPIDTISPSTLDQIANSSWCHHHTAGVGTASYAAPEQVVTETYGTAVDIFSLGLILLELACCFSTEHERLQTFQNCRNQRTVPSDIQDNFPLLAQVVLNCTRPNPTQRPTAADLKYVDLRCQQKVQAMDDTQFASELHNNQCTSPDHESMKKIISEKDQQIAEMKLQLEQYQCELMQKNEIIAQLSQSNATHDFHV